MVFASGTVEADLPVLAPLHFLIRTDIKLQLATSAVKVVDSTDISWSGALFVRLLGRTHGILQGECDGHPFIAGIDHSFKSFAGKAKYPWFLSVTTPLQNPTVHGFPTNSEANDLNAWEDEIEAALKSSVASYKYIGG